MNFSFNATHINLAFKLNNTVEVNMANQLILTFQNNLFQTEKKSHKFLSKSAQRCTAMWKFMAAHIYFYTIMNA